jgi:hypothetical protein
VESSEWEMERAPFPTQNYHNKEFIMKRLKNKEQIIYMNLLETLYRMQGALGMSDKQHTDVNLKLVLPTPSIKSLYLTPWIPVWVKLIPSNDML